MSCSEGQVVYKSTQKGTKVWDGDDMLLKQAPKSFTMIFGLKTSFFKKKIFIYF